MVARRGSQALACGRGDSCKRAPGVQAAADAGRMTSVTARLALINPVRLAEPVDHAGWLFEAKFDGFRAAADTVHGRLISGNGNWMHRFDEVLDLLPKGYVFDGELVVLDDAGRPLFNELPFGRRRPTYVAFDLLIAEGIDLRPLPLKQRKTRLARLGNTRRLDCAHQRRRRRRAGTFPSRGRSRP